MITVKKRYVWPTVSTTLSSTFGERVHPITGELKMIDYLGIAGKTGDSIYAVADGHIMDVGFDNALGNYIVLSKLLHEVINFAKENSFEIIDLQVRSDNLSAIHLYEKFGFKKIGTHSAFFKIDDEEIAFDYMCLKI